MAGDLPATIQRDVAPHITAESRHLATTPRESDQIGCDVECFTAAWRARDLVISVPICIYESPHGFELGRRHARALKSAAVLVGDTPEDPEAGRQDDPKLGSARPAQPDVRTDAAMILRDHRVEGDRVRRGRLHREPTFRIRPRPPAGDEHHDARVLDGTALTVLDAAKELVVQREQIEFQPYIPRLIADQKNRLRAPANRLLRTGNTDHTGADFRCVHGG